MGTPALLFPLLSLLYRGIHPHNTWLQGSSAAKTVNVTDWLAYLGMKRYVLNKGFPQFSWQYTPLNVCAGVQIRRQIYRRRLQYYWCTFTNWRRKWPCNPRAFPFLSPLSFPFFVVQILHFFIFCFVFVLSYRETWTTWVSSRATRKLFSQRSAKSKRIWPGGTISCAHFLFFFVCSTLSALCVFASHRFFLICS